MLRKINKLCCEYKINNIFYLHKLYMYKLLIYDFSGIIYIHKIFEKL